MPLLSLARPIENISSPDEARVLAIIDHLSPMLDHWREGQDLDEEANRVQAELDDLRTRFSATRQKIEAVRQRAQTDAATMRLFGLATVILIAAGMLILILAHGLAWLGLLALAIGGGVGFAWTRRRSHSLAMAAQGNRLEVEAAQLDTSIATLVSRQSTIEEERVRRSGGFPMVSFADVRFGLKVVDIAGQKVILDESGSFPDVSLRTIDVSSLESGVADISSKIEGLLNVPPLLSPNQASDASDPIERVYGEENQLNNLVTDFTSNLGLLKDVELTLPLVPNDSSLAIRLRHDDLPLLEDRPAITVAHPIGLPGSLAAFTDEVSRTKRDGQRIFAELQEVYNQLDAGCRLYSLARSQSINTLHAELIEVLQRASWCNRRFYCARMIMSPLYIEDLLGINLDQAYRLSLDDLIERLRGDASIDQRLDLKSDLETQLREAHLSVQEFMGATGLDDESALPVVRPRHLEDQLREALQAFRRVLQKVMTGSSFPVLNFSAEAILYYDPEIEEWSSDLSPHAYRSHEVMRYGSVVKSYSDLMIPLWEHLWTEKADFRKSETFRTNDQLLRMSEKEAEKLIDIANQFRNDLRTVRENMHILGADLKSKAAEIVNFKDGMNALGLLSDHAREAIERNSGGINEEETDIATRADRFETILAAQPQAQMESRGTVQDPIEFVRGLDALLTLRPASGPRLLSS